MRRSVYTFKRENEKSRAMAARPDLWPTRGSRRTAPWQTRVSAVLPQCMFGCQESTAWTPAGLVRYLTRGVECLPAMLSNHLQLTEIAEKALDFVGLQAPVRPDILAAKSGIEVVPSGMADPCARAIEIDFEMPWPEQLISIARGCSRLLLVEGGAAPTRAAVDELAWQLCRVFPAPSSATPQPFPAVESI